MNNPSIKFEQFPLTPYKQIWELQKKLRQERIENPSLSGVVLLGEHPPVITKGKSTAPENLLYSEQEILEKGITVESIERGGDITYHGPGQLVGYPILNLNNWKRDVHWYMRSLEEVIIRTLSDFGIKGNRIEGKTGVWVSNKNENKKIASLGVHLSKWITLHGFSINVEKKFPDGFSLINPCGFQSSDMIWMNDLRSDPLSPSALIPVVITQFNEVFKN